MENLAIYIWQSMKRELEAPELLFEVKLMDKEENCVVYNGTGGYSGKRGQSILTSDTDWTNILNHFILRWKLIDILKKLFSLIDSTPNEIQIKPTRNEMHATELIVALDFAKIV